MNESETIKKEIRELTKQKDEAKTKLNANLGAINQTKVELEEVERNLAKLKKEEELHISTNEALTREVADNKKSIHDLYDEKAQILKEVGPIRVERDSLIKEKNALGKEIADIRREAEEAADAIIEEANKKVVEAEKKADSLKKDNEVAEEALDKKTRDYKDLVLKEGELSTKIEESKKALDEANIELDGVKQDATNRAEVVASLNRDIEEKNGTLTTLVEGIQRATDDKAKAEVEVEAKKKELEDVKVKYEEENNKLFLIADREKALKQRYLLIEQKYKDAGIPFSPIPGM
jgi:chromosome segregation ATPase